MAEKKFVVPEILPILPVRDTVLFPGAVLPLTVGRESSLALVNALQGEEKMLGVVAQLDPRVEDPAAADLHKVGTLAKVHKTVKMPNGNVVIFLEGLQRIQMVDLVGLRPFLRARVQAEPDIIGEADTELEALQRNAQDLFRDVVSHSPQLSDDLQSVAMNIDDPGRLTDFIAGTLPSLSTLLRQELIETPSVRKRLESLIRELSKELEVLELRSKIHEQVQEQVSQNQREYLLREQMKAIQKELGESDDSMQEIDELRKKVEEAGMTAEAKKECDRELKRLSKMTPASAEYMVSRTYLEWMTSLPWSKSSGSSEIDIAKGREILDEDHYDLQKVKERILDYLAVKKLQPGMKGPILCFVGPPGVGKTSLGKSIARSLGRKFVRIALGGMHDEAEIRGHRRTYIGALPGQIIQGLKRGETNDPVMMLDEVDKLGRDFRGDPSSALMEVLDPEQNNAFRDHYLDVPFDLSKVLFIATANWMDPIPEPLRDRMEIIELPGYTGEEKLHIAHKYLIPKQAAEHGLRVDEQIAFTDEGLREIIHSFTREAGVRNLEREIATITRKQARRIAEDKTEKMVVTPEIVREFLGVPKFRTEKEVEERVKRPGVAVGLVWTPVGGDIIFIEATRMRGGKQFTMTGHLGEVMQESMTAALTWTRANGERYGIDPDFFRKQDIHIHVPSGAVPKDGPSAGAAMVTALVSLLSGRPVKNRLAMTGEMTLSGVVLPIGGVKEKVLGAKRAGITEVLLPADNEPNVVADLTPEILGDIKITYVRTLDEVLEHALQTEALTPPIVPQPEPKQKRVGPEGPRAIH
ncbi:MAG: endopeptidase La [Acidobacteria bacterium]|nr:MAG: endopeptidase La [Acidobacteriota bacterium]PYU47009.1 MAG: endopeptidase La [Acidobacteriota bacterium]PYU60877.1 MAG: endopeptidase La [Acidobacteriota bacterium]PYU75084.1 MAG: endopeptidase La [Acidobacteriota bacterium]